MPTKKIGMARVVVDYGYDLHTLVLPRLTLAKIQAGEPMVVEGQGFPVEGELEQDHWTFNYGALGALHISTDTGREVFEGNLGDAEVGVSGPKI